MARTHTVKQGEHISNIADKYGFLDYLIIWDHAKNADLKKQRNPNVLLPGDQIFIPDKKPKTELISTRRAHVFEVVSRSLKLQIVLKDPDGRPIVNMDGELEVEGTNFAVKSDAQGIVKSEISKPTIHGALRVPSLRIAFPFLVGFLDPVEEQSGCVARLANLGYYQASVPAKEHRLRCAIEEFQYEHGIRVTGALDNATRAKLKEAHGC